MTKEATDDEQAVIVGQGLLETGLIHHGELCVCLCVCLSVCVHMCACSCTYLCMYVCVYVCVCMYVSRCIAETIHTYA